MDLGIDLGTSSVKALVADRGEAVVATAEVPLAPRQPRPGWSEDDPDAWWTAVATALDRIAATDPALLPRVRAIGLSGQMHGALLLDGADRPVRPAILWNDGRAGAEAMALAGRRDLSLLCGVKPAPGFTGPIVRWLRANEPAALERVRHLLLPKDWIRLKLTGQRCSDASDAAGTWLFDQGRRAWSPEAAVACGIDTVWLPRVDESTAATGTIRPEHCARWGFAASTIVAGGGGDTSVGGVGIGAVEDGRGFVSLGTSGQVFLAASRYSADPDRMVHAFCHALPGRWFRMAALLNGASPLAAAARWTGRADVGTLLAEVEAGFRAPAPLLALPYLFGERTPHGDPAARGALVGLTAGTTPAEIAQAVMEAVAFSLADGLEVLLVDGRAPSELGFIGGGSRSRLWARMIASVLGTTLVRYAGSERGPAFGAARLARLAATGEDPLAVARPPAIADVVAPEPRLAEAYAPRLVRFRALYRSLHSEFQQSAAEHGHGTGINPS